MKDPDEVIVAASFEKLVEKVTSERNLGEYLYCKEIDRITFFSFFFFLLFFYQWFCFVLFFIKFLYKESICKTTFFSPYYQFPIDLELVKIFLYTYQSYATPEQLLYALFQRLYVKRKDTMSLDEFLCRRDIIRTQVINTLKLWVNIRGEFKG